MNKKIYMAVSLLEESARRRDLGLFWKSIHGTLSHVAWADFVWLSRFGVGERPKTNLQGSADFITGWEELQIVRAALDEKIQAWTLKLSEGDLVGDLVWESAAMKAEVRKPRTLCMVHMFNHQTHHRGQVHAALTALGQDIGNTDLPFVV